MTLFLLLSTLLTTLVTGIIKDKTTGQPLVAVTVTASENGQSHAARSDSQGRFQLGKLPGGTYTLHLSSNDVPPQDFHVMISGKTAHLTLRACSTTLDYSCGDQNSPGGS